MKSKRSKATDISQKIKEKVFKRDQGCCVVCGNTYNVMPNAHIVPRSKGGLGIETNVVTMCTNLTEHHCHDRYDNGSIAEKNKIKKKIIKYMKSIYGNTWKESNQCYERH